MTAAPAAAVGLPGIIFKFKIYQMECEIWLIEIPSKLFTLENRRSVVWPGASTRTTTARILKSLWKYVFDI